MGKVQLHAPVSASRLFEVLSDGWLYAGWVVGATHIRDVDEDWPAVGTRIHHTVGAWPVQLSDSTSVVAMEPDRLLELDARAWPVGRGRIRIELTPERDGTRIRMSERAVGGPTTLVPQPLLDLPLIPRNKESLRRLVDIAAGRTQDEHGGGQR